MTHIHAKSYQQYQDEERRLFVLRLLMEAHGYASNNLLLLVALESLGHVVGRAVVGDDLAFLQDHKLVEVCSGIDGICLIRLTEQGLDVACGRELVPGIRHLWPGEL